MDKRKYQYNSPSWPHFTWDADVLLPLVGAVQYQNGFLVGKMDSLGFDQRQEVTRDALVQEVRKSSEIEGETLDWDQIRSSVSRRMGMDIAGLPTADRHVDGVVEMVLDATRNYQKPLSSARLFNWHKLLFPEGASGLYKIEVGQWRTGDMQVVSGPIGHERVHFEAVAPSDVEAEMESFLAWYSKDKPASGILKAGIAHLWFVTVHPFDDGNGRIGRAIMDMALAKSDNRAWRCYSMSAQIRNERDDYYAILEKTQSGSMDITPYLVWFTECLGRAFAEADSTLVRAMQRARFWHSHSQVAFNDRQRKMVAKLLDDFYGKLTNEKWAAMTKSSRDTALRDINDLVAKGVLRKDEGGGRSTNYSLIQVD